MAENAIFPQEIFDEVLSFFGSVVFQERLASPYNSFGFQDWRLSNAQRSALGVYSLISRDWLLSIRKYMFQHIKIMKGSERKAQDLIQLLSSPNETISTWICSFALEIYPGHEHITTPLVNTLAAKGLYPTRLSVKFSEETAGSCIDNLGLSALLSHWAPYVTSLQIEWVDVKLAGLDESAFGRVVSCFTNLAAVEIGVPGYYWTPLLLSNRYTFSSAPTSLSMGPAVLRLPAGQDLIIWLLAQDAIKITSLNIVNAAKRTPLISGYSPVLRHLSVDLDVNDYDLQSLTYVRLPHLTTLVLTFDLHKILLPSKYLQSLELPSLRSLKLQVSSTTPKRKVSRNWIVLQPIIESYQTLIKVHVHLIWMQNPQAIAIQRELLREYYQSWPHRETLCLSSYMTEPVSLFPPGK